MVWSLGLVYKRRIDSKLIRTVPNRTESFQTELNHLVQPDLGQFMAYDSIVHLIDTSQIWYGMSYIKSYQFSTKTIPVLGTANLGHERAKANQIINGLDNPLGHHKLNKPLKFIPKLQDGSTCVMAIN